MSIGYSGMGAWCLFLPSTVIGLSLTPQYVSYDRTTLLLMRCFGAQAMTCGLLLGTATMTKRSFTAFGLAMIPYLTFNAWFGIGPGQGMFTPLLWLDFVGNVTFGLGSLYCASLLTETKKD
ncbi:uncharacterized protein N7484_001192 [Penicillium longicatenatum]|uniref:uncharacterized protein n=1 Tax=Penicillium longicatenatum TaxID=1561947 RepID=UPI002546F1A1|nr:uncharacterized protein N7484_001192 [Penicillium longicatenatum]KAJ5657543.1 hypothetical protein N7484_001192 [Penicillium longicatenatum]